MARMSGQGGHSKVESLLLPLDFCANTALNRMTWEPISERRVIYTGWHLMGGSDSKLFMGRVVWEILWSITQRRMVYGSYLAFRPGS